MSNKPISALKLANKLCATQRLTDNVYIDNLSDIPFRYESLAPTSAAGDLDRDTKEKAISLAWHMMVDQIDLKVSDRILVSEDEKTLVVCAVQAFNEFSVSHYEVLLREVASLLHEDVELLKLGSTQPNFDPLFKMWASAKVYETNIVKALIDKVKPGVFADLQDAGRITDADFIITFDLPITISVKDKIKYNGIEYFIDSIEEFAYQTMAVVKKVTPEGRQFPV